LRRKRETVQKRKKVGSKESGRKINISGIDDRSLGEWDEK
jgi:hypothetical protein